MGNPESVECLETYWHDIPVGKSNSIGYDELCQKWGMNSRAVRLMLRELSIYDNGDDYILIRSGSNRGFYRTDDINDIVKYKKECLNKGRALFAPIKKINRVLDGADVRQVSLINNLKLIRQSLELSQGAVCAEVSKHIPHFDVPLLSRMENGLCLPTPEQVEILAKIYGCDASQLVALEKYQGTKETA